MTRRTTIAVFMLVALALRSLVPGGFMIAPAEAGDGSVEIVICTSAGQKTIHVSKDSAPSQSSEQDQDAAQDLCPFAFSGTTTIAEDQAELASTVAYAALTYKLAEALFAETPKPGAVSARGPPLV